MRALASLVVAISLAQNLAALGGERGESDLQPWTGGAKPRFVLRAVDGAAVDLRGLHGRVVFVHFFATWCEPCREELPALRRLSERASADRIAVVGGGLVGLLVAYLCARLPAAEVTVVDVAAARAKLAHALGARFAQPDAAPADCDLVFHASGTGAGLATALRLAGEEAVIVELSWYGSGEVAAPLGEAFHSRRLRLVSSQVGKVAPSHRSRWTHRRRLAAALALLDAPALDLLLAPAIAFAELPAKLPSVFASDAEGVCPLIRYPAADDIQ